MSGADPNANGQEERRQSLYEKMDPEPSGDQVGGRKRIRAPENADAERARLDKKAEAEKRRRERMREANRPAPEVAAQQAEKPPAVQIAQSKELTKEQQDTRTLILGMLSNGWHEGTRRLIGVALVGPDPKAPKADLAAWSELVAARPDVGMAAGAYKQWIAAVDAVALKRGWYKEMPAEWMLLASTIGLAVTVGIVAWNNIQIAKAQKAAPQQATEEKPSEAVEPAPATE